MNRIFILTDDPTAFGGIQQFVRNLAGYLSDVPAFLLPIYADPRNQKTVDTPVLPLNDRPKRTLRQRIYGSPAGVYRSENALLRAMAALRDRPIIRARLNTLLAEGGDTIVVNAFSQLHLFLSTEVLRKNRIVLVQHQNPLIMKDRRYDFGGVMRNRKLELFRDFVDAMVFLSPFDEKVFRTYLPLDGKELRVIRHALVLPPNPPMTKTKDVAVLSRLVPVKRIDRVIETARILTDFCFHIYGDGPEKQKLEQLASDVKNIRFHGYISKPEEIFQKTGILLITSDYEGYNLGGIEAMAHGKPLVVLNRYPAAADLVIDGQNGRLIDHYSPAATAEAILDVDKNYEHYHLGALKLRPRYDANIIREQWRDLLIGRAAGTK